MKDLRISIAMATYNGATFIAEQLESFSSQTRRPDEVVICDDGSSDDTIAIVERFARTTPYPVRVFRNETNVGYTRNFEKALSLCNGDIVFLSDQDDVWFSEKVEYIVNLFENEKTIYLIVHDGVIVDENLSGSGVTKFGQIKSGLGQQNSPITGALSAMRREFLFMALPFPAGVTGHDVWLHGLGKALGRRRFVSDECLQMIRRHTSNTSEWIVNSTRKIGKLDVLKSQLREKAAVSYLDRIVFNEALRQRLSELLESGLSDGDAEHAEAMLASLDIEQLALDKRTRLVASGFVGKRLLALSMLANGDYRHFNGLRSFARDVLR